MRLKQITTIFLFLLFSMSTVAQMDASSQKNLKKASKYIKKEKYPKAAVLVKGVIQKYPVNENLWKYYQDIMYKTYSTSAFLNLGNIEISTDETSTESTELIRQLQYIMQKPKYDYFNSVNYASMSVPYNANSSIMMRNFYVDGLYYNSDSINTESKEHYRDAEQEFQAKNYEQAIKYYQKSYEADSNNYKALLYIGDSYFAMEYFGKAAEYFRKAMIVQPLMGEPIKYLADALERKGQNEKALEVAKQSLLVYPDEAMFMLIYRLLNEGEIKELDRKWVLRLATINSTDELKHREQFFDEPLHFKHYISALENLKEYYSDSGILKEDVDKQLSTYLEVQCWKEMLSATVDEDIPALDYSRKMVKEGMLTPYLLINLFNVDLYSQYRHLIDNNEELAKRYINDYLIIDSKD